jgi:glycosyltransferase involved in cell wall biosynthesis
MNKVKISVVIPLYNRESQIEETLRSISTQTLKPSEIVVVDDSSTDRSTDVVRRFAVSSEIPINLIQNTRKKGVSGARNAGILQACGDYIAFQDSDDLWLPSHLDRLHSALVAFPNCKIAFARHKMFGGELQELHGDGISSFQYNIDRIVHAAFTDNLHGTRSSNDRLTSTLIRFGVPFRIQATIVDRNLVLERAIFFEEQIGYNEDALFLIELSRASRFCYVEEVGCLVRRHLVGTSKSRYLEQEKKSIKLWISHHRNWLSEVGRTDHSDLYECLLHSIERMEYDLFALNSSGAGLFQRLRLAKLFFAEHLSFRAFKSCVKSVIFDR